MNEISNPLPMPARPRRGIALVITLLLLVLLSAFAVAFFTRMSVEQVSAASYADGISTRQLADSAVGVVMSQIREATTVVNGAWASQPGMIRVFGGKTSGNDQSDPYGYYKLYSAKSMTETANLGSFDAANEIDSTWYNKSALWTDLNEPVEVTYMDSAGNDQKVKRYPILDPSLAYIGTGGGSPHDSNKHTIEGFSIDNKLDEYKANPEGRMPVRWIYVLRDGTLTSPDGEADGGKTATWDEGTGQETRRVPSKANPIVGRVAFWADDDTSKVNINTAGGFTVQDIGQYTPQNYAGSFWDTPRFFTVFERGGILDSAHLGAISPGEGSLALCQPPANEFQRYPGHPATTSLGLVFSKPNLTKGKLEIEARLSSEQLYRLLPRVRPGGSRGGTDRLIASTSYYSRAYTGTDDTGIQQLRDSTLPLKAERLYSSVDEFFFAARQKNGQRETINDFLQQPETIDNFTTVAKLNSDLVEPEQLEGYRFFLTAHNRSSDLNLFGRPRVAIWPVWASGVTDSSTGKDYSEKNSALDKLISFCSTAGPAKTRVSDTDRMFIFQRYDPYSKSADSNIARNGALLRYLGDRIDGLTSQVVPGFAGTFAAKYPNGDRDQILAEIFDYVRVCNLKDTTRFKEDPANRVTADNMATYVNKVQPYMYAPRGIVVPSTVRINPTSQEAVGFGRFPTVSEVSLIFYHAGYVKRVQGEGGAMQERYFFDPTRKNDGFDFNLMRAFMVVEGFNPMQGFAPTSSFTSTEVLQQKKIVHEVIWEDRPFASFLDENGTMQHYPLDFPASRKNDVTVASGSYWGGRNNVGMEGFCHAFMDYRGLSSLKILDPAAPAMIPVMPVGFNYPSNPQLYPFQTGNPLKIPVNAARPGPEGTPGPNGTFIPETFLFSNENGGSVSARVKVYFGLDQVQEFKMTFPAANFPMPSDAYWYRTDVSTQALGTEGGGFAWDNTQFNFPMQGSMGSVSKGKPEWAKSLATRLYWLFCAIPPSSSGGSYAPLAARDGGGNAINGDYGGLNFANRWRNIIQPGDTVRSLVIGDPAKTDIRSQALVRSPDVVELKPLGGYSRPDIRHVQMIPTNLTSSAQLASFTPEMSQTLRGGDGNPYVTGTAVEPIRSLNGTEIVYGWTLRRYQPKFGNVAKINTPNPIGAYGTRAAELPGRFGSALVNGVMRSDNQPGDFDSGLGNLPDGSFCNKPDEGNVIWRYPDDTNKKWSYEYPYFTDKNTETHDTFFSPNRQIPSAVMFGSLLAGRRANWQTLCFCPNPAGDNHPGNRAGVPKDHLLLDLFTMPVVEPYAISEPFSTAGRVNLNCELMPFSYIRRTTALRAALHPLRLGAVNESYVGTYKSGQTVNSVVVSLPVNFRLRLNRDETIKSITSLFEDTTVSADKRFYRSATQICERYLYPAEVNSAGSSSTPPVWVQNDSQIKNFWSNNTLEGDNVREKPYADLYPRVTTKSNTFTVHMRVQKLRMPQGSKPEDYRKWVERENAIAAEYRGESQIERYIDPQDRRFDPNDSTIPSSEKINVDARKFVAGNPQTRSLEFAYRFRVLHTKRFSPDR